MNACDQPAAVPIANASAWCARSRSWIAVSTMANTSDMSPALCHSVHPLGSTHHLVMSTSHPQSRRPEQWISCLNTCCSLCSKTLGSCWTRQHAMTLQVLVYMCGHGLAECCLYSRPYYEAIVANCKTEGYGSHILDFNTCRHLREPVLPHMIRPIQS